MKKGSLVTPSELFWKELPLMIKYKITFIPREPEKGQVFVVEDLIKSPQGEDCVVVEGLRASYGSGEMLFNLYLWREVQPPGEVEVSKLIEETELV